MRVYEIFESELDKPTPTPKTLAKKYSKSLEYINTKLTAGIKVEKEHTSHESIAREIALDHLGERIDYYDRLKKVEEERTTMKVKDIISEAANPAQQAAIAINMKKHGKKPKDEVDEVKQRLDPKCWTGKHKEGTKIKGGIRVNNCVPNESVEEAADAAVFESLRVDQSTQNSRWYVVDGEKGIAGPFIERSTAERKMAEINDRRKAMSRRGFLKGAGVAGAAAATGAAGYGIYKADEYIEAQEQKFLSQITDPTDIEAYTKLKAERDSYPIADTKISYSGGKSNTTSTPNPMFSYYDGQLDSMRSKLKKKYNIIESVEEDLTPDEQFDMIEEMVEELALHYGVDSEEIWEHFEGVDDDELFETAAWQKSSGKNKNGGLNQKGVNSYRREHPGSKLQTAVTTKPSKLKKGSKAANRRKSFCARMKGMKKHRTGAKTKRDPNSRINKSLRKWNC